MTGIHTQIVCLLTDFGPKGNHYVAQMKAVILKVNPFVRIIDISHNIRPFSIIEGSYVFKTTYKLYPPKTVFIIVIDPGVGSQRRIIAVKTLNNHFLIAPDNGLFSLIFEKEEIVECIYIQEESYFHHPVSETFHGRDIMAPVAAYISKGNNLNSFGPKIQFSSVKSYKNPLYIDHNSNKIEGIIQYIDSYGNLTTNIPISEGLQLSNSSLKLEYKNSLTLVTGSKSYTGIFSRFFSEVPKNEIVFIKGSTGYLEVSLNQGSAAELTKLNIGDSLTIIFEICR